MKLSVDFSKINGKIRPLHGVNSGPMTKVFTYDARPFFREIGITYSRLHDVEYPYGSGEFVDIPCIFRNFDADETDPQNYNFALTDEYLDRCIEVGAEPFFRLGVSIEHAPIKRYIYPPKDFSKWARICEHIIRHYTEGWANGYNWKIDYWEIWNEADGDGNMWLGTAEEYYEFYTVAARHLKKCFPHLKIGGGGFCRGVDPFTVGFLKYLAEQNEIFGERVPLDFYSWHKYFSDVKKMVDDASATDALLAEYGYADAESVFDEWNYMLGWTVAEQSESYRRMKNHIGASHHAATLCALQQNTNVSLACYFEADVVKEFCGIFEVVDMAIGAGRHAKLGPTKGFYPFKHFGELYRFGNAVRVNGCSDEIYAAAATSSDGQGILVSNYSADNKNLSLCIKGANSTKISVFFTDQARTCDKTACFEPAFDGTLVLPLEMPPYSVAWIGSEN